MRTGRMICWLKRFTGISLLLAAAATSFSKEPVTLRFTVWDGNESLKVLHQVIDRFQRENPDIKVELENFDYTLYHQKMMVQYAADDAPDVAMEDMGHFAQLAKRGALLPLNQFFGSTPGFDIHAYYAPIVRAHSMGGKVYVLPRDIAPEGLIYYNKQALDEAGIPYPDGTWTWDFKIRPELREKDFGWVCQQLTKTNYKGKDHRWAFASGWPEELAQTFMYSSGGDVANDLEHPTWVMMDSSRVVAAYQLASDYMNKWHFMPNSTETSGVMMQTTQQMFAGGDIALYENGIWDVPDMRKALIPGTKGFFEWDITLFPAFRDGTRAAPTGGSGYAIFTSTKHPQEAWRLCRYMAGPVGMTAMAQAGIAQPAIRALALMPDVWLPGPHTPKEQLYPHNRLATDQAVPYVKFAPIADYWPAVTTRIGSPLDLLWSGQTTAKAALTVSEERGQEVLDRSLKTERLSPFNWSAGLAVGLTIAVVIIGWVYLPERKVKYSSRDKRESLAAYRFASPWIIGAVVFTLGPMILSLMMSFADWDIITPAKWRGIGNYAEAGAVDPLFWKSMLVTAIYTGVSVPLGIIMSLVLALLLNQKVRGVEIFRSLYYVPSLASAVAASLIWRRMFNPDKGLINAIIYGPSGHSWLGTKLSEIGGTPHAHLDWFGNERFAVPAMIIMSVWGAGGAMVILLAGLQGIPQFYYEAATLDGAGMFAKFKAVTIPLLTPTLFFCLVTGLIGTFQVFTQAYVITSGGPNDTTRFYMLYLWNAAFEQLRMGFASAGAWILFFVILVLTLVQLVMSKRWVFYEAEAK